MANEQPLTCKELVEIITDYLENRLPSSERSRFEAHLAGCTGCTNYVSQMRRTITLLGSLTEEDLPPQTQQDLLAIFQNWKTASQNGPSDS
jgi:anti-sigma factor RsiW